MPILSPSDYPAVRASLDISLDADDLPDEVIEMSVYLEAAELEVLDRDPLAASRTGSDKTYVKNAVVYWTASLLAPALPRILSRGSDGDSERYQQVDLEDMVQTLQQRAIDALAKVLTPSDVTPLMPTVFTVVSGTRGK